MTASLHTKMFHYIYLSLHVSKYYEFKLLNFLSHVIERNMLLNYNFSSYENAKNMGFWSLGQFYLHEMQSLSLYIGN